MNCRPIFILLLVLVSSVPQTLGSFSGRSSRRLVSFINGTALGRDSIDDIRQAVDIIRLEFSDCRPKVCFAVDGSASISRQEFRLQSNFVQLVAAVLGGLRGASFAANQYGGIVETVSPLTKSLLRRRGFLSRIGRSTQLGSPITFIAPGLLSCVSLLENQSQSSRSKIVLLGDGRSNFSPDSGRLGAVSIARRFRNGDDENEVCAVLVGENDAGRALFRSIVGQQGTLVTPFSWRRVGPALSRVVRDICD